jgi:hypothetical protein
MPGGTGYRVLWRAHDPETLRLRNSKPFAAAPLVRWLDMATMVLSLGAERHHGFLMRRAMEVCEEGWHARRI